MKTVRVRNVPDELYSALMARAAEEGRTVSDYILAELPRLASKPTTEEIRARIRSRAHVAGPPRSRSSPPDRRRRNAP
jgi:antitoxin FitA